MSTFREDQAERDREAALRVPYAGCFGETNPMKQELFEKWQAMREVGPAWSAAWCTSCGDRGEQLTGDGYCGYCLERMWERELGMWDAGESAITALLSGLHNDGAMPSEAIVRATCEALTHAANPEHLEHGAELLRAHAAKQRERLESLR